MSIQIGTAPDAWGVWFPDDPRQVPWPRFLDEVVEVGYQWIELGPYGYLPADLPFLRRELDRRGLKVCASVVEENLEDPAAWSRVEAQVLGSGELAAGLDGQFMVLIDGAYFDLSTGVPTGPARLAFPVLTGICALRRPREQIPRLDVAGLETELNSEVMHAHRTNPRKTIFCRVISPGSPAIPGSLSR